MWRIIAFSVTFLCITQKGTCADEKSEGNNYEIIFEAIERYNVKDYIIQIQSARIARQQTEEGKILSLNVTGTTTEDVPPTALLEVVAYEKRGNSYSKIPTKLISDNLCNFMKTDKFAYKKLVAHGNLPDTCPFKKMDFHVLNFNVDPNQLPKDLPGERWRIDLRISVAYTEVFKLSVFVYIHRFSKDK